MAELQLPKLIARVRFPSSAPTASCQASCDSSQSSWDTLGEPRPARQRSRSRRLGSSVQTRPKPRVPLPISPLTRYEQLGVPRPLTCCLDPHPVTDQARGSRQQRHAVAIDPWSVKEELKADVGRRKRGCLLPTRLDRVDQERRRVVALAISQTAPSSRAAESRTTRTMIRTW
jgi:hypothetical protein